MRLKYEIILFQAGNSIYGTAEKTSEITTNGRHDYPHINRIRVKFRGTIERKYFSKDIIHLHWDEDGLKRTTSSYFEIKRFDDDYMFGRYNSTAAESNGISEWVRDLTQLKVIQCPLD